MFATEPAEDDIGEFELPDADDDEELLTVNLTPRNTGH